MNVVNLVMTDTFLTFSFLLFSPTPPFPTVVCFCFCVCFPLSRDWTRPAWAQLKARGSLCCSCRAGHFVFSSLDSTCVTFSSFLFKSKHGRMCAHQLPSAQKYRNCWANEHDFKGQWWGAPASLPAFKGLSSPGRAGPAHRAPLKWLSSLWLS